MKHWALILAATLLLGGCNFAGNSGEPAPVGDRAALERLADAYREVSKQTDQNIGQLSPGERKHFVELVFNEAGYSYPATLEAVARSKVNGQYRQDLIKLLLLPHNGGRQMIDPRTVYSDGELEHVLAIERALD